MRVRVPLAIIVHVPVEVPDETDLTGWRLCDMGSLEPVVSDDEAWTGAGLLEPVTASMFDLFAQEYPALFGAITAYLASVGEPDRPVEMTTWLGVAPAQRIV